MNTCETCAHWDEHLKHPNGRQGTCLLTEGWSPKPEAKLWVSERTGTYAVIVTRPDFGCNQHKPKE